MASKKTEPKLTVKAIAAAPAKSKVSPIPKAASGSAASESAASKSAASKSAASKSAASKSAASKSTASKTMAAVVKTAAPKATAGVEGRGARGAQKIEAFAPIAEGSSAPDFSLLDDSGGTVNSASLSGKPYVLYFYPKDDTPGCTTEACEFRDNLRAFNDKKLRVIGVSPDEPARHAKFKQKYGLNFTLLSDVDKTLANAYGVWVEKQNYGRTYLGVERSTFLIDKSGKIAKVWRRVRVPGHVAAVLESF